MNYRKGARSIRNTEAYRHLFFVILTTVFILFFVLLGSSIAGSGQISAASGKSYKYYTSIGIEQGDTLWDIAKEYITPEYADLQEYIDEIKELNNLGDDEIHSGQYLMIPYFAEELK